MDEQAIKIMDRWTSKIVNTLIDKQIVRAIIDVPNFQDLINPTDKRIFTVAAALYNGYHIPDLYNMTRIDHWFLYKMEKMIKCIKNLKQLEPEVSHYKFVINNFKTLFTYFQYMYIFNTYLFCMFL